MARAERSQVQLGNEENLGTRRFGFETLRCRPVCLRFPHRFQFALSRSILRKEKWLLKRPVRRALFIEGGDALFGFGGFAGFQVVAQREFNVFPDLR